MKNERRQKLAKNDLVNILENTINSAKEHSAIITRLVLVLVIAILLLLLWRMFAAKNKQDFYNDLKQLTTFNMSGLDGEQFDNTIKSYVTKYPSGSNNATVSLLIGDIYLNRATVALAEGKRDEAITHYETALGYYTIADRFQFKQQDSAESAVWGLAQTNVALAALKEGDYMDAAKSAYERLCKTWPDGVRYELASEQLNWLNRLVMANFPEKYRQSDPVLFAPDLHIPDMTEPIGDFDTTITPGDFQIDLQSLLDRLATEGETQEFDAGLTLSESEEPETHETPQDSGEPQNPATEPVPE
jgi:tetratricopeptide (TPR) repeat protein